MVERLVKGRKIDVTAERALGRLVRLHKVCLVMKLHSQPSTEFPGGLLIPIGRCLRSVCYRRLVSDRAESCSSRRRMIVRRIREHASAEIWECDAPIWRVIARHVISIDASSQDAVERDAVTTRDSRLPQFRILRSTYKSL